MAAVRRRVEKSRSKQQSRSGCCCGIHRANFRLRAGVGRRLALVSSKSLRTFLVGVGGTDPGRASRRRPVCCSRRAAPRKAPFLISLICFRARKRKDRAIVLRLRRQHRLPIGDCWGSERVSCLHCLQARRYPRNAANAYWQTSVVPLQNIHDATSGFFGQVFCTFCQANSQVAS